MELSNLYVNEYGLCCYDYGEYNYIIGVGMYQEQDWFFIFEYE